MGFSMDVEEPKVEEVVKALEPEPEVKDALTLKAQENVKALLAVDLNSMNSRRSMTSMIEEFGQDVVERSKSKNALLKTRIVDLQKDGGENSVVVKSLSELNVQMRDLDPSLIDFSRSGILGKIFNPMREYFAKYEKADAVINDIMDKLEKGRKTLVNDNTTLELEQQAIRQNTLTLNKQLDLGTKMDEELERVIEEARIDMRDPDKIKFLEEEILFPLRQRLADLQQMQAVNQQGYFAMEVVRKNNKELIRAVDRAAYVTTSALRTAVMVAAALNNQRIVLKCVEELNNTTNDLIKATSQMLLQQGTEIQKNAMETAITPETLREAFSATFEAMDMLDNYKREALPRLKSTIAEFQEMAIEGERRIQRMEAGYDVV